MTYLQLINGVLRRMRESQVTTVDESNYSVLVADFINDAKRFVEDRHDWTALRTTITVPTVASTYNYALTGASSRSKLLDANNTTSKCRLRQSSLGEFNNYFLLSTPASGSPDKFFMRGADANGDPSIDVYPIPDAVYSLAFDVVVKQADLEDAADVLTVPYQPVLLLAVAFAARERGETGGASAQELFSIADLALSDAVQMDAGNHPGELMWNVA